MSASTGTSPRLPVVIPAQRDAPPPPSARYRWPDQVPATHVWMAGVGQPDLHRVQDWRRVPATGLIHARCGKAAAVLWSEARPGLYSGRRPCLHCTEPDDFAD